MANLPPAKKRGSSGSAREELKSAESGARALGASTAEGADINPASAKNQEAAEEFVPGKSSSEVATRVVTPAPAREEAKTKEAGSNASVNSKAEKPRANLEVAAASAVQEVVRATSDPLDRLVHACEASFTGFLSPVSLTLAYLDWALHLANAPGRRLELADRVHLSTGQTGTDRDYEVHYQQQTRSGWQSQNVHGLRNLMHSSLAITTAGLPLGLCAVKFWTRDKFKGTAALKRKINPTRVPIEKKESIRWLENLKQSTELLDDPGRCIHIGDRESDIYELFCTAQEVGTHFLVRTCVDRLAGDGDHTVADEMDVTSVKGLHRIEVRDDKGDLEEAILEIRYRRIRILPPVGKQKRYPALTLTVIHAQEQKTPKNRKKIEWKLLTDLPVQSRKDAIEKLEWYAMRWKIEMFHKILKSGCKAEELRLRTAERLANLISLFCILSWRIFWMTMLNRSTPTALPSAALTETEIELLDHLVKDEAQAASRRKTLSQYLIKIAKLGGYLARANDPPPGNIVMWRGLSRLTDIGLGAAIGARIVGN